MSEAITDLPAGWSARCWVGPQTGKRVLQVYKNGVERAFGRLRDDDCPRAKALEWISMERDGK